MRQHVALAAAVACAALAGSAFAQPNNQFGPDFKPGEASPYVDSRPDWKEGDSALPAYPQASNLIEYAASALSSFRFFVDAESITPGSDGIVRYTLVGRSSSGTENVSFNGLRCRTAEHKLFASGRASDKTWVPVRDSQWKVLEAKTYNSQHLVLMRDFFCPAAVPIMTRAEGIDALRKGFHPHAIGYHPGSDRF
jgi:CNP1-like family